MNTPTSAGSPDRRTLDDYLSAGDITPLAPLRGVDWDDIRRTSSRTLAWRFCTLRNLVAHRGRFVNDAMGFAWGGIYRTLLVSSIVTTSYRNEGHVRAGHRIRGTSDYFYGSFVLPDTAAAFRDIVDIVNLRHHVAGVARPDGRDGVRVIDGYEADFAYVSTAFIEAIRRGLDICGLPPDSRAGRSIGGKVATILYQLAGFAGLTRVPRDLDAHDRFRDAFDRHLRDCPPSPRVRRMAQEIARRIVPRTAQTAGVTVQEHIRRHIDPETRDFLFPGGVIDPAWERQRQEWQREFGTETIAGIEQRAALRERFYARPDIAALREAYREVVFVNDDDLNDDRIIGAILLHAIDSRGEAVPPLERRRIDLAPNEPLIRQGDQTKEMYVVLSATAPLVVLYQDAPSAVPRQVAALAAPTVLGEIGMWRGKPAVATVLSRESNRLDVLVVDAARFAALKGEPGFRAATAAEVQRRLALSATRLGALLDLEAARTGDPRIASIVQLFHYLTGESHVPLDKVIGLEGAATTEECIDALRAQIDDVSRSGTLTPELRRHLATVVATIG